MTINSALGVQEAQDDRAELVEEKDLHNFDRAGEFLSILSQLLGPTEDPALLEDRAGSSNLTSEAHVAYPDSRAGMLSTLETILNEYQEQSYLLDPFLEQMVGPPIRVLQSSARESTQETTSSTQDSHSEPLRAEDEKVTCAAHLLYLYTKVRGYKTIIRYFPHQVSDVVPTVNSLLPCLETGPGSDVQMVQTSWHLRYILLLWLSLVCMIPFELSKFDVSQPGSPAVQTSDEIVRICRHFLSSSGRERDAAAITLAKLFQRQDTSHTHLPHFIRWCKDEVSALARPNALLTTGVLQTLCELLKVATPDVVVPFLPDIQVILSMGDYGTEDSDTLKALRQNRLVNKYRSKLAARMGLKILKPRKNGRGITRKQLGGGVAGPSSQTPDGEDVGDDLGVPEEIDAYIAQLLNGLQDADTVVRYSAAKGLSRICERLPPHFIDQVAEAITQLFTINVLSNPGTDMDLSAVSEHTWQGACLALAELARRGLLDKSDMRGQIDWTRRALFFDVRRGSHSVGSAVRDAACYFFWALSRAYDPETLRPHAVVLAQSLTTLSLLDREISIRRAASAAFQECVGRLGIFPHGIEIIGKTDFFSVGIRRNAFLQCTPQVARHLEYRSFILNHLMTRVIPHWDPAVRSLGSQAIARIVALDVDTLVPYIVEKLAPLCRSRDIFTLHGALMALAHIAAVCKQQENGVTSAQRRQISELLVQVPRQGLKSLGMGQVLEAVCMVIVHAASATSTNEARSAWKAFMDAAGLRKEESIHVALADAWRVFSEFQDCSTWIVNEISGWGRLAEPQQQSLSLILGAVKIDSASAFEQVLRFLTALVTKTSPSYSARIEVRRNAIESIAAALLRTDAAILRDVDGSTVRRCWTALVDAMDDYTTDQRGDVGSWVRVASLQGSRRLIDAFQKQAVPRDSLDTWLPEEAYHDVLAAMAKQMTERIDNVRAEAASHFLHLCTGSTHNSAPREPEGLALIQEIFELRSNGEESLPSWAQLRDPSYLFPRVTRLLLISRYRTSVLRGLVQAIGTKTELSQRIVAQALLDFAMDDHDAFSARALLETLVEAATNNFASSKTATPYLQTILHILESDVLMLLTQQDDSCLPLLRRVLVLASRSLDKIKTPQRLTITMGIVVGLLAVENKELRRDCVALLPIFLGHAFPTVSLRNCTRSS